MKTLFAAVAALALSAFGAHASTNLIANGSFEAENFSGWTTGGNFADTAVVEGPFYVYSGAEDGSFYAVLGPVGGDGTLSQTFSDSAGQSLVVSFWFDAVGDNPSDFTASFDGSTLYTATNPDTGGWELFQFDVTGTGSDTLEFAFRDDPAYMALDNVSVTSGTPEPATWALVLAGFAGLGSALRSRRRRYEVA